MHEEKVPGTRKYADVAPRLDGALAETVTGSITQDMPKLQLADLELISSMDVNLEATDKVYTVV